VVLIARDYTRWVQGYGLKHDFITPHCRQQDGIVERVMRTLKEQCFHIYGLEILESTMSIIGDWIRFYNKETPHQALGMTYQSGRIH
jgi:putative transposase